MSAEERFVEAAKQELEHLAADGYCNWAGVCDSPIETLLLAALTFGVSVEKWSRPTSRGLTLNVAKTPEQVVVGAINIFPQYRWRQFRIDFAFKWKDVELFVECDGHSFHERTAEQAEHDRSRDRAIQEAGITIIRFTGREIYRDPFGCVGQIFGFLNSMINRRRAAAKSDHGG